MYLHSQHKKANNSREIMKKPTQKKVKKLLEKKFGWENLLNKTEVSWISDELIEDTISVMMDLIEQDKQARNKDL
jgi:uncharacterized protein YhaN